jgi:hypothetical protein
LLFSREILPYSLFLRCSPSQLLAAESGEQRISNCAVDLRKDAGSGQRILVEIVRVLREPHSVSLTHFGRSKNLTSRPPVISQFPGWSSNTFNHTTPALAAGRPRRHGHITEHEGVARLQTLSEALAGTTFRCVPQTSDFITSTLPTPSIGFFTLEPSFLLWARNRNAMPR